MPRFIAVHSVALKEEQLKEMAKKPLPEGISWLRAYCSYADNKGFCEWEAPAKKDVEQLLQQVQVPYDAVYDVRLFDVATATLEP